jgi:hypothetical protein
LCPKSANIYPLYIVRSNPFTAFLSPNYFFKFLIFKQSLFCSCFFKES